MCFDLYLGLIVWSRFPAMTTESDLTRKLAELQREWQQLHDSLPAHSIPASMLIRLEELEDEISDLQAQISRSNGQEEHMPD